MHQLLAPAVPQPCLSQRLDGPRPRQDHWAAATCDSAARDVESTKIFTWTSINLIQRPPLCSAKLASCRFSPRPENPRSRCGFCHAVSAGLFPRSANTISARAVETATQVTLPFTFREMSGEDEILRTEPLPANSAAIPPNPVDESAALGPPPSGTVTTDPAHPPQPPLPGDSAMTKAEKVERHGLPEPASPRHGGEFESSPAKRIKLEKGIHDRNRNAHRKHDLTSSTQAKSTPADRRGLRRSSLSKSTGYDAGIGRLSG